jgi:hypothetical protein
MAAILTYLDGEVKSWYTLKVKDWKTVKLADPGKGNR